MSNKPVIVFAFPDCMGGVASFNRNLINFTSFREKCIIRVILLQAEEDDRARFTDIIEADEVITFRFSTLENQYMVCKRLDGLLGKEPGCILTDNAQVLNTIGLFGSAKAVIYMVHDYFYINWALEYHTSIDAAVAHSGFFRDILLAANPTNYKRKAFFIPYGVEQAAAGWIKREPSGNLKLIFLGRLVSEKGVLLLKEIDEHIRRAGATVDWTIVGKGPLQKDLEEQWKGAKNVRLIQAGDTAEVYQLLEEHDILVFPSQFEGTPVSIMEAMSRGALPVVSDLPGGTRDMVTEDLGVRCPVDDARSYADAILVFDRDRRNLIKTQQTAIASARERYNIRKAADNYFSFLIERASGPVVHGVGISRLSKLDRRGLPGWLVKGIRTLRKSK